ncbi:MAG TPA: UDP-N-acetylglucosamine 2-epimerase (non-hydrolyzing) [Gammaproteobacteria bacterium]|nr:UDP-N-acetylglucosamine 2-epimerase (non-hydrolyzing) [Gammaproteobacteria bacterium]
MPKIIHLICAARPNFMKIAPLYHALAAQEWAKPVIIHTGQHYDINMSDAFFQDLKLPSPHIHLEVGSGSHAELTAKVMVAYEKVVMETRPHMVVVVGDVNSTIACTLAAVKIHYPENLPGYITNKPVIAHLEAGLRSRDRTMPEEINRLATDVLADLLWTPSRDGDENLLNEGVAAEKISFVGNIMIDSLEMMRPHIESIDEYTPLGLSKGQYAVVTLHRPANVDHEDSLKKLVTMLDHISQKLPIVFPIHPRTRAQLDKHNLLETLDYNKNIRISEPLNYIRFMNLVFNSQMAITDSGGLQEETTVLGIPCLTMRPNTERPVTISLGTNRLCTLDNVEEYVDLIVAGNFPKGKIPELWDGATAQRITSEINKLLCPENSD